MSSELSPSDETNRIAQLSRTGCALVLVVAFLGWMFAGVQLAVSSLVMRDAAKDLLVTSSLVTGSETSTSETRSEEVGEDVIGQWFGWLISAFLFGAAAGGYFFGWLGDRVGRAKAMALSIACYSIFSGLTYFVQTPSQLLVMRFLTCMGIGGMWPNGIALVSEAWPNISRPFLAGAIGTAANVGIMLFSALACVVFITPDDWRWVPLLGTAPVLLALFAWFFVPESPRWLNLRNEDSTEQTQPTTSIADVFRPPVLRTTIIGIMLGAVPLFGGWGNSNWVAAWTAQVGEETQVESNDNSNDGPQSSEPRKADPALKARATLARSAPGSLSSLLGGALAVLLGRRRCYFLLNLAALVCSLYLFRFLHPTHEHFMFVYGALGFFSGFFFGWLPLCLPEMFPTRVRATGAGVSFNFGRIITAFGILVIAGLMKQWFGGNYAAIGQVTSFVYAVGMVVIFFAPGSLIGQLED